MSVYHVADIVLSTRHIAIKKKADIIILKKKKIKKKKADKNFSVHMESTFCGQN